MGEPAVSAQWCRLGKNYRKIRNFERAAAYLRKAIERGSSEAARELFELACSLTEQISPQNWALAESSFRLLAERGHGGACLKMGEIFEAGKGREKDHETAFSYYAEAYRLGEPQGAYRAGCILLSHGQDERGIRKVASEWLEEAVEAGIPEACTAMGKLYWDGRPVSSRNNRIALAWFLRGVRGGDPEAMLLAASFFRKGVAVAEDPAEAFRLCREASAKGQAKADLYLADMYRCGSGVEKDMDRALEHYRLALERGEHRGASWGALAAYGEGRKYMEGKGVRKNRKTAARFLEAAAEFGYVPAMNDLGILCCSGSSVTEKKQKEALQWFQRGMKMGDLTYAADNYRQLALKLGDRCRIRGEKARKKEGKGRRKPEPFLKQAEEYYRKAADGSWPDGWAALADLYMHWGKELYIQEEQFLEAALKGLKGEIRNSRNLLWRYYGEEDLGKPLLFRRPDPVKAFETALEGAESGDPYFMGAAADCYRKGLGTVKNEGRAFLWETRMKDACEEKNRLSFSLRIGKETDSSEGIKKE